MSSMFYNKVGVRSSNNIQDIAAKPSYDTITNPNLYNKNELKSYKKYKEVNPTRSYKTHPKGKIKDNRYFYIANGDRIKTIDPKQFNIGELKSHFSNYKESPEKSRSSIKNSIKSFQDKFDPGDDSTDRNPESNRFITELKTILIQNGYNQMFIDSFINKLTNGRHSYLNELERAIYNRYHLEQLFPRLDESVRPLQPIQPQPIQPIQPQPIQPIQPQPIQPIQPQPIQIQQIQNQIQDLIQQQHSLIQQNIDMQDPNLRRNIEANIRHQLQLQRQVNILQQQNIRPPNPVNDDDDDDDDDDDVFYDVKEIPLNILPALDDDKDGLLDEKHDGKTNDLKEKTAIKKVQNRPINDVPDVKSINQPLIDLYTNTPKDLISIRDELKTYDDLIKSMKIPNISSLEGRISNIKEDIKHAEKVIKTSRTNTDRIRSRKYIKKQSKILDDLVTQKDILTKQTELTTMFNILDDPEEVVNDILESKISKSLVLGMLYKYQDDPDSLSDKEVKNLIDIVSNINLIESDEKNLYKDTLDAIRKIKSGELESETKELEKLEEKDLKDVKEVEELEVSDKLSLNTSGYAEYIKMNKKQQDDFWFKLASKRDKSIKDMKALRSKKWITRVKTNFDTSKISISNALHDIKLGTHEYNPKTNKLRKLDIISIPKPPIIGNGKSKSKSKSKGKSKGKSKSKGKVKSKGKGKSKVKSKGKRKILITVL